MAAGLSRPGAAPASAEARPDGHRASILVLPTYYPDLADPQEYNGNWVQEQTHALASRYDMSVVYPVQTTGAPAVERYRRDGVSACIVRYRHIRKTWLLAYLLAVRAGIRALDARPRCVHAHGLYPSGLVATLLARLLGVPLVITEHWGNLPERMRGSAAVAFLLRYVLRRASRVVAVSRTFADEMRAVESRCRPVVVYNTILPAFFEQPLSPPSPSGLPLRVLFVGRLADARKGLLDLLEAMALHAGRRPRRAVHLTIVGDGPQRESAERRANELGLGAACVFLGQRPRPEIVGLMAACDLLAVPSHYETFGVVFAEAMACGKPVIGPAIGPVQEIVPPWAGRLVRPGDHEAIAAALEFMAGAPPFDAARIRAHAEESFGARAFLDAMSGVLDPLLAGPAGHARTPA